MNTRNLVAPHHERNQERTSSGVENFARRWLNGASIVILLLAALWLIWYMLQVFLLLFAGVLLAILLRIPIDWLRDHTPLSDGWAFTLVALLIVGLLGGSGWLLAPLIGAQLTQLSQTLPQSLEQFYLSLYDYTWIARLLDQVASMQQLVPRATSVLAQATGIFSGILDALTNVLIILFAGFYLAVQPGIYRRGVLRLVPQARRQRIEEVMMSVGHTLKWWLLSRVFSMVVLGVCTVIGLWLLDVPFALTLGVITGLFNFIPFLGTYIAIIPAVLIALLEGPTTLLYVLLFYTGVQMVESYFLTPAVQQRAVSVPPALGLTGQVVLGVLGGMLGLVLALPLTTMGLVLVRMCYVEDVLGESVSGADKAED